MNPESVLAGPVDHTRLLAEVTRGLATLLVEKTGPHGRPYHHIVVQRADGSVWDATFTHRRAERVAQRWGEQEAAQLLNIERDRGARLQAVVSERDRALEEWVRSRYGERPEGRMTPREREVLQDVEGRPRPRILVTDHVERLQAMGHITGALERARTLEAAS